MKTALWTLAILSLSSAFSLALAQDPAPRRAPTPPPDAIYEFEGDVVDGAAVNPNGSILHAHRPGRRASLVRARAHFLPELAASVEDL